MAEVEDAGRRVHRLPIRVYFEDTDAGGIVYHTAYLRFAERGRTEYLRHAGFTHAGIRETSGGGFVVSSMNMDFKRAARLDDELVVETSLSRISGARMCMDQEVLHDGKVLVRLAVNLALLSSEGRPSRIPEQLRGTLAGMTDR